MAIHVLIGPHLGSYGLIREKCTLLAHHIWDMTKNMILSMARQSGVAVSKLRRAKEYARNPAPGAKLGVQMRPSDWFSLLWKRRGRISIQSSSGGIAGCNKSFFCIVALCVRAWLFATALAVGLSRPRGNRFTSLFGGGTPTGICIASDRDQCVTL